MFGFQKIEDHAELVRQMADRLGVDITEEMQSGRLTPDDLDATVRRCLSCLQVGECRHFLAATVPGGAAAAPTYCVNKDLLEAMRAQ